MECFLLNGIKLVKMHDDGKLIYLAINIYCGADWCSGCALGRGVPGSSLVRGAVLGGLEQVTFPQLYL